MLVIAWFWAAAAAFTPANLVTMSAQAIEAQCATMEAVAQPLLMLGLDEDHPDSFF